MEFLNPNVFYIMMIPLVLLFVLLITSKSGIEKHFSKKILQQLKVGNQYLSKKSRNILYFIVLILFIISLARPVMNKKEQDVKQSLIPIVIALDVSKSMLVEDIYPNRISMAKKKLQKIIEKSKNSTIGIVLFAKDSFILSPVTEDFISLKYIVDNLDTKLNFANGSNIFSILEATKYMLADFKVKNLIILSDGGNEDDYKEELSFAKENDIVIYSIGLATKKGAPIPNENGYVTNKNGDIVTLKLNESIKNLSLKSAGGYIDYSLDSTDVDAIINRINIQSKKEELNIQKVKTYTELFYYPLSLALLLLLLSLSSFPRFKKKQTHNSIILFIGLSSCFITPIKTYAYTFNFENIQNANEAYKNKEYSKASDNYRKVSQNSQSFYNLGNSLYKEKKYEDAIKAYNKVITNDTNLEAQKLYNLGNSYVQTNKLEKAKEFYEKALKIKDDKDTKENLELVNKELAKQKQQQENKNKEDKKKEQDKNKQKDDQKNKENQQNKNQDTQNQKDKEDKSNKKENNEQTKPQSKEQKDKQNQENKKSEPNKNQEQKQDEANDAKDIEKKQQEKKNKAQQMQLQQQSAKPQKNEISEMEEKKWMKILQNQQAPIYLQKVKTNKASNHDEKQPW
ncbi:MAG: tetratricopeptide repeat protein [Arcobacteraceae bacterium]